MSAIKDASVFFSSFQPCRALVIPVVLNSFFRTVLAEPLDKLGNTAYGMIGELMQREEIAYAFTTFATSNPQYQLNINEARAKQLGVSVSELLQTLQVYYGSSFVSDFNRFGKYYRVIVQADVPYRADPSSIGDVFVKNNQGQMVPATDSSRFATCVRSGNSNPK